MKTRTNQPVFLDNGELVNDGALGGTKLYKHQITMACSGASGSNNFKVDIISSKEIAYTKATLESDATIRGFYNVLMENTNTHVYGVYTNGYLSLQQNQKGIIVNGVLGQSISSITSDVFSAL